MSMVRFDCGCIGFFVDEEAWCVNPCDFDYSDHLGPLSLFPREELAKKKWEALSPSETKDYLKSIERLISDGYRFRQIQSLLKETVNE